MPTRKTQAIWIKNFSRGAKSVEPSATMGRMNSSTILPRAVEPVVWERATATMHSITSSSVPIYFFM